MDEAIAFASLYKLMSSNCTSHTLVTSCRPGTVRVQFEQNWWIPRLLFLTAELRIPMAQRNWKALNNVETDMFSNINVGPVLFVSNIDWTYPPPFKKATSRLFRKTGGKILPNAHNLIGLLIHCKIYKKDYSSLLCTNFSESEVCAGEKH